MVKVQHFNEAIEQHLTKIGAELSVRHAEHEERKLPERDRVREVVSDAVSQVLASGTAPKTVSAPSTSEPAQSNLPGYLSNSSADPAARGEVERLVLIAFESRIPEAVEKSRNLPPFVQDAFHDALIDRIMPELKSRGLI